MPSAALLMVCLLAACAPVTVTSEGSATEQALCEAWRDSLPTRSHADTEQTQAEIGRAYDVVGVTCEER